MLGTVIENLSLTDALLLIGLVGITIKTLMEGKGWTRSSKLLREENADLIARNHTLEEDRNDRIAIEITLNARIDALEAKVRDLESRDQAAVLQALRDHELGAIGRAEETHRLLQESTVQLVRIAESLENVPEELGGGEYS